MTQKNKELMHEARMIQGNVNRMIVTDELSELVSMKDWALARVNRVFEIKLKSFDLEEES